MDYKFKNISIMQFVKTLATYRGLSLRKLLELLSKEKGFNNCYPAFYNKLKNSTIKFSDINEIADYLGYEIEFKDLKQ